MSVTFNNGAIVKEDLFYNRTYYDISNNLLTAQFDGLGGLSKYSVINKWNFLEYFFNQMSFNGKVFDVHTPKKVTMIGRQMVIETETDDAYLKITQFAGDKINAIFEEFEVTAKEDVTFENVINLELDYSSYIRNLFKDRLSFKNFARLAKGYIATAIKGHKHNSDEGDFITIRSRTVEDFCFDFAVSKPARALEDNKYCTNQLVGEISLKKGETGRVKIVISGGTLGDISYADVKECYLKFDEYKKEANAYVEDLECPAVCDTEFLKAYYKSLYNCSLSMYKEMGKFKGFLAGIVYQSPARTYYRDGYWTILSVLPRRPDLVRNEIITLASGINKDGDCPSAVKYNFTNWWGNHYDSPSFFAIMLYDYVRTTGDRSILKERWRGKTILDAAVKVIEKLAQEEDSTGLLYKGGAYNRRDWCDNVFRQGYCTYDEVLYARALYALSELYKGIDNKKSSDYNTRWLKVKQAINDILWEPKLGYYVNYKDENFTEDNLSIDTVIAALFGVASDEQARSMLAKMEALLESKNNTEQKGGDFGVLSVYPFYKDNKSVVLKSSWPFYYHNGGDWPYWSCAYAYAKLKYGMDYYYPLTRWFEYNLEKGNYTPVEFYAPMHKEGSLLQAWSSVGAFVLSYPDGKFFD